MPDAQGLASCDSRLSPAGTMVAVATTAWHHSPMLHASRLAARPSTPTPAPSPSCPGSAAVMFIHGAANDHSVWALQSRYFAYHGFNVLAVDLPGHGKSAGPALPSIEDMAAWAMRVLDAAGDRESRARRTQHGLADRARDGGTPSGAGGKAGADRHRVPDESVRRAARYRPRRTTTRRWR